MASANAHAAAIAAPVPVAMENNVAEFAVMVECPVHMEGPVRTQITHTPGPRLCVIERGHAICRLVAAIIHVR